MKQELVIVQDLGSLYCIFIKWKNVSE